MPNLVFPTCSSLQIWGQTQTGVHPNSRFLVKSPITENCHNCRTSDDIEMKLNVIRETKQRQKILMMTSCQKIVTLLSFFQFMSSLEQSGSWIPDADSVKLIFSLIVTFYITKTENRTKKSLTKLSQFCSE